MSTQNYATELTMQHMYKLSDIIIKRLQNHKPFHKNTIIPAHKAGLI